jgi:hypothetical protein
VYEGRKAIRINKFVVVVVVVVVAVVSSIKFGEFLD